MTLMETKLLRRRSEANPQPFRILWNLGVIRDLALVHHDSSRVTMETGRPGLASAPLHISSIAAQTEKRMEVQAPLTAIYIHTAQPAAAREPAKLHLAMPPLYSKETLPFLTLHIAGGLQSQLGLSLPPAAAAAAAPKPKSAGKHMCPHCGRDCMKPSVLEKHLRCHTGERPYPCTTCGVSFKTQSNLYKHKRTQAHARLSSESEQSSIDNMSSSSLSLDEHSEKSGSVEKNATLPAAEITCPASAANIYSVKTQRSGCEQNVMTPASQKTEANEREGEKQKMANETPLLTASRHLPLQRQEATRFSKQWESSESRRKSQSHESTDSGFSESSDHYPSPGSVLPDHSMDSLMESTKEHLKETPSTQTPLAPGQDGQEPKYIAREHEQNTLEERISKLISENTAVVEDKQLENVRPRKTVLSKQGSIDLPMPYTYKDSFHFDMRISKTPNVGLQRNRKHDFYSSVPTQHSNAVEHAPLTRSNSLPFSVTLLQPERSSPTSSYQRDYVTLGQRGSSSHINPTGFSIKPVNQHSSTHRPLVRQTAVDGNHAPDGLFVNSSVEEACTSSLSCDGDGGDICGEPSNRKFRRKKAQKFAYNKWYMYGGGTFKKLYSPEKGGDDSVIKGRKCLTNPEPEVVQGMQKVHKETVTTISYNSSSATLCHPGCPPAKLSLVSAGDLNLITSQLQASCSSLKSPLQRNLSLSILPLSSIGSSISHQPDNMNRAEPGRMIEEKHTDSTLQLSGAHNPSDRKKQKTDDKTICPMEIKTNPNTPTHPLPSVTGSAPQQDTNLSYINLQKHTQLKAALFPTCIINATTPSVSTSTATSTPSPAKASFLPKYQLRLPNAAEPDSNPSPHVVDKPTGTFTSALSSSHTEQTSPSFKTSKPVTSPLMQTCDIKKTNAFSTQDQLLLPCKATTVCQAKISRLSSNAVEHMQFAANTITTSCLQNDQAGLCSTLIHTLKSARNSAPMQLPRPGAPWSIPATPTITTANSKMPAADITAFSQGLTNPNPPLSHTQSPASDQLSPLNSAHGSSNTPLVPCHIVPYNQMQPDAQNVFHVHTADLQICLQIISDEQLALMEPQIERQAGSVLSQRPDVKAVAPEVIQNEAQSSVTMGSSNDGSHHLQQGHQQHGDQSESLFTGNMERKNPPMSAQIGKNEPNLPLTKDSISTQATLSAQSTPAEALGSSIRPQQYAHGNTLTVTQSSTGDMSTAALLKSAKSGRSNTSEEEHALSLNRCAEEQLLRDRRVSRGGLISQTLSGQHKLSGTSLSHFKNQAASCNVGTMKAIGEASAYGGSRLESGETHPPLQVGLSQASGAEGADELSGSVSSISINKFKASRQLNSQAAIYGSNSVESTSSEAHISMKHANMGCDRVRPSEDFQEMTLSELQDLNSSTHSEKQLAHFISVSSNIRLEGPKDIPAVLTSIQSAPAVIREGAPLTQTLGHGEAPGHPDCADCRPKKSQEAGKTNVQCMEGRGGAGVAGEDKNETDEVPGQWDQAESNCTYTCLADMTKAKGEDRKVDSFKDSWLSEQHLHNLSQTHSGMSEYPPQSPHQTPSKSINLNHCSISSQRSLFSSPQVPLDMNNFYFSQQHWESSILHNQQTQILCESDSSQGIRAHSTPTLTETQHALSQIESSPQQKPTFFHPDQQQSSISANNIPAVSSSVLPDVITHPSTYPSQPFYSVQVSRAAAGLTGEMSSEPSTSSELDDYQDNNDTAANDCTSQSSDITNKCHSFYLSGQLRGYEPECLPGGVRPTQSCLEYTEDTSSSDDEGKLIIEL